MNHPTTKLAPLVLVCLALAACGKPAASTPADAKPRVLVSNPPTAWLVKQIAGDKVIVQTLSAPGGCGHGYQPTDAEMAEAGKAQVWLTVGLDFENSKWAKNLDKSSANARFFDSFQGRLTPEKSGEHYWMSLPHVLEMAKTAHRPFLGFACGNLNGVENPAELQRLEEFLRSLHAHLTQLLAPLKNQAFLADHAAYGHFAADYGLEQIAIEEDEHASVSDARLTEIIAEAKQAQVKVLFLAEEANRPLAEAVAKAVGAKVVAADPNEENTPALLERMADELVKAHAAKP